MQFDDIEHSTLNQTCDFSLEDVEFDHDKKSMTCVYESFYMAYDPEFGTFAFDD